MEELTLFERILRVNTSVYKGYLLHQTRIDGRMFISTWENTEIGFFLDEIINFMFNSK